MIDAPIIMEEMATEVKALAPLTTLCQGMVAYMDGCESGVVKKGEERPELTLYIRSSCPYCVKVTNYLKKHGKKIPTVDIGKDKGGKADLIRIGGKQQVPCLIIDGEALYESSDILQWLKTHKNKY